MIPRKLMIVEDEMLVQLHLEQIIKDMGHEVIAKVTTAKQAIEEASREVPELVLMDISLPGPRDGISAAKELRERFGCEVVFATAHVDDDTLARAEAVDASGYLVKPFSSTQVNAVLRTALARCGRTVEVAERRVVESRDPDVERPVGRPFGHGTRMLVYSHDTFGMGHLQRSMKLIRAVMEKHPGTSVLLVTGSPVVHRYELPPGADYVKLPAVQKIGADAYASRSLAMSGDGVRNFRSNLLLRIVRDYDPNVLLVDHSPAGMQGELVPSLEWLSERTNCRRILGLRDVTDDGENVRALWKKQGVYELLETSYDHIVVYGDREFYDPVVEYQLSTGTRAKVQYMGFVCDQSSTHDTCAPVEKCPQRVAVSIGGGDGAASMIESYLDMVRQFGAQLNVTSEILTGPLVAPEDKRRIYAKAEGLPVVIHEFMQSTTRFFADADLVIATAGYNTVTQILCHAKRALLIPRVLHRREQLVRSRRLESLELVACLNPMDCSPERLFAAVRDALSEPRLALVEARKRNRLPLDGAERFAEFCGQLTVEAREEVSS